MMGDMPMARFNSLCTDATDAALLGRFWAGVFDADLVTRDDGVARVDLEPGVEGNRSIWVNPVPEPRFGKTRVHLDLRLPAPEPAALIAGGAVLLREPDGDVRWWVLADPDGNEFCAFPPREGTRPTTTEVYELVVDCRDAAAQAAWWARVTGGRAEPEDDAAAVVGAAGFPWEYWVFGPVPEPKTVKNRVHWDVDLAGPDPSALVEAGATVLREPDGEIRWWIMADPEGNEFCAFAADEG
jgi:hypothetical protein